MSTGKNKVTNRTGFINRPSYNKFIKQNPKSGVTYEQYIQVLKTSTAAIRDHILTNPLGFKLPYNFGYIAIDKFKPSKDWQAIDWVNTKRLRRRIPLTNLHSFGYTYKVKFYPNPRIKPLVAYDMRAHRLLNRAISKQVKGGKDVYIPLDRTYFSKRFAIDQKYQKLY